MTMFRVQMVSRDSVKPSSPTPPHLRTYNLSLIDQFYPSSHVTVVLFYHHGGEPIAERLRVLKRSLSHTLTRFYPLAGRLKGNSTVDCNDQGVDFLTAQLARSTRLTQFLRNPDERLLEHLLPCSASCVQDPGRGALLSLQVTNFACNGMAIGACISHKIADGTSLVAFLNAWAAEARGDSAAPCRPVLGAATLFWPIEQPPTILEPGMKEGLVLRRFVLDEAAIDILRTGEKSGTPRPTRFEAVTALLWRSITRARARAGSEGVAAAVLLLDLRRRMVPPLPELTFGNLITAEVASVTGGGSDEEGDGGESCLFQQLRATVGRVDDEYVRRLQGPEGFLWAAEVAGELVGLDGASFDGYLFSSWCRFPIYDVDFGWGEPIWAGVGKSSDANVIILMDRRLDGGVEAWVTVEEEVMAELEQDEELCSFVFPHPSATV